MPYVLSLTNGNLSLGSTCEIKISINFNKSGHLGFAIFIITKLAIHIHKSGNSLVVIAKQISGNVTLLCITSGRSNNRRKIIIHSINFLQTNYCRSVLYICKTVSVSNKSIRNYSISIARTIFFKIITFCVNVIFTNDLISARNNLIVFEAIILAINGIPTGSMWSRTFIVSCTKQSLCPYTRGKFAVYEVKGYVIDFNIAIGADAGCRIEVVPSIANHLPARQHIAILDIVVVAADFNKTSRSACIAAVLANQSTLLGFIFMALSFNRGTPVNNRVALFAEGAAGITCYSTSGVHILKRLCGMNMRIGDLRVISRQTACFPLRGGNLHGRCKGGNRSIRFNKFTHLHISHDRHKTIVLSS